MGGTGGTVLAPVRADPPPPPLWQQNFDDQVAGEQPKGWSHSWGEQGDDQFVISNELCLSPKNSFLLDRTGTNVAQWGCVAGLPEITTGWGVLSWCVRVQGAGNDIAAGFEVREPQLKGHFANVGLSGGKVVLKSGDWKSGAMLGAYTADQWYRITLWLPTAEGKQTAVWGRMEARQEDGTWKAVGERLSVPLGDIETKYGALMLTVAPNKRNFKLFAEDFKLVTGTEDLPPMG